MTLDNYTLPNFDRIRESREAIRYQAIIGSANLYIDALNDELIGLNAAVSNTDQLVANAVTSAITALETGDLHENLQALKFLKNGVANTQTEDAIKRYSTIIMQLMELCTEKMSQLHAELNTGVFNVQSISITNNRFRLEELAEATQIIDKELNAEQEPLENLIKDEAVLNLAISEFEKQTFIDRLKPLLEQLKTLIGNKPQTPETAAIEAGMIVAIKFLDEANELIKYQDLIKARNIIQTRITQRKERVSYLERQLRENANKTRQLNDTQNVLPHQQTYVSESKKLTNALSTFLDAIMPSANDEILARGERLLEYSPPLLIYMNTVQSHWIRG
jgi:hypothetical protein